MFSGNDDHLRAAISGYAHQVIHISNTQGTPEQVSSLRGGGADPKPQPNTPLPCAPPWLGPRSGAGQMPELEDESQGDRSEGTALPNRIPPLRLGSSANDRRLNWNDAALACAKHSPPGCKGPVVGSLGGAVSQKGMWGPAGEAAFMHSSKNLAPGRWARGRCIQQVPPTGERCPWRWPCHSAPCGAASAVLGRHCECVCVRACACGNDPSADSLTETLLPLLLRIESQV